MSKRSRTHNDSSKNDDHIIQNALFKQHQSNGGYQTFQNCGNMTNACNLPVPEHGNELVPSFHKCFFAGLCVKQPLTDHPLSDQTKNGRSAEPTIIISRRMIILISIFVGLLACTKKRSYKYLLPDIPEWHWDHNVYLPRNYDNPPPATNTQIALLAQIVSSQPLKTLSDVSSRPNRAYARQWGMDYTEYDSGRASYHPKACFDKVFVLNTILDRQSLEGNESSLLWSHPDRVHYDTMVLLSPDSIITNLDTNLFDEMLPSNKLTAIAGWTDAKKLNSQSGIVLFNLRHKYAGPVAKRWWDMALPPDVSCGANNDLGMLFSAIASVMDPSEDLDDLIQTLEESDDGIVGDRMIKCIPPPVPGPRLEILMDNLADSRTNLQETADAVCYRYYPRCEVIVA